jgi:hypothetical protein
MAPGRVASTSRTSPVAGGAGPPGQLEGWVDRLEHGRWRVPDARRAEVVGAAAATTGLLVGLSMGAWLGLRVALLVAMLTGWRLRFRPSATARVWRRQAAAQRRTAGMLAGSTRAGRVPGAARRHPTGMAGQPRPPPDRTDRGLGGQVVVALVACDPPQGHRARTRAGGSDGMLRGLRGETAAVADALTGATTMPVRALLCAHGWTRPAAGRSAQELQVATPRRVAGAVRGGPRLPRRGGPAGHRRRPGGPPPGHVAAGHGRNLRASRHSRVLRHHPQGVTAPTRRRSHRADAFRS